MSGLKTYLLDTNILLHSPYAIFAFDEHDVCISDVTLEELDRFKDAAGELGANARETARIFDKLLEERPKTRGSPFLDGIPLPMTGGTFRIVMSKEQGDARFLPPHWDAKKPDNQLLETCLSLNKRCSNLILVSNDILLRCKAENLGLKAESYRTDQIKNMDNLYSGRTELLVVPGAIEAFYKDGCIWKDQVYTELEDDALSLNQFVLLKDSSNLQKTALAKFNGEQLVALEYVTQTPYDVKPRNNGQRFMQEALLSPVENIPLVIVKGSAGSAKTFYALACGLEQTVNREDYRKILLTRPNVKFDEDIGFLKGSEEEKIMPLLRPFLDNLEVLTQINEGQTYIDELFDHGYVEAQAMAYMRGRSITDTYIIVDEAQNCTPLQIFGMVSRAGTGTKVVLLGDPNQIDNPRLDSRTNGLVFAADRMQGSALCAQITMEDTECVRSPLAEEAIRRMSPKGYKQH